MSRAFVREDLDPPERSGRKRSASGLPPGAVNYITARGAARLQRELDDLRQARAPNEQGIAELEGVLASVTVVALEDAVSDSIGFGAEVTVRDLDGREQIYRIVGVNELGFEPNTVSWISPIGRALLAAEPGGRVTLDQIGQAKVVKVEYPTE